MQYSSSTPSLYASLKPGGLLVTLEKFEGVMYCKPFFYYNGVRQII